MAHSHAGYDIESYLEDDSSASSRSSRSTGPGTRRARGCRTPNSRRRTNYGDQYWLYVVEHARPRRASGRSRIPAAGSTVRVHRRLAAPGRGPARRPRRESTRDQLGARASTGTRRARREPPAHRLRRRRQDRGGLAARRRAAAPPRRRSPRTSSPSRSTSAPPPSSRTAIALRYEERPGPAKGSPTSTSARSTASASSCCSSTTPTRSPTACSTTSSSAS